jgi:hypothetical protein
MKCYYCDQECILIYGELDKIIRWACEPCDANFRFLKEGGLLYISWKNIWVNNTQYFIKLYCGVTGNAPEFVINFYTQNESGKHYWEELIRWDFIPESWTPQNATEKLKTFLPFI